VVAEEALEEGRERLALLRALRLAGGFALALEKGQWSSPKVGSRSRCSPLWMFRGVCEVIRKKVGLLGDRATMEGLANGRVIIWNAMTLGDGVYIRRPGIFLTR